jgi:hypothetical protein
MLSLGTCFQNHNVDKYFEILEKALETHNFTPDRVYNVDETGLTIAMDVVCSHNQEEERVAEFG